MNLPGAEFLMGYELDQWRADQTAALADEEVGRGLVDYVRRGGTVTHDFSAGTQSFTGDVTYQVPAVRREAERDSIAGIQVGDYWYLIPADTLPFDTLGAADVIVDGPDTFNLIRGEKSPSGSIWRILTRREGTT